MEQDTPFFSGEKGDEIIKGMQSIIFYDSKDNSTISPSKIFEPYFGLTDLIEKNRNSDSRKAIGLNSIIINTEDESKTVIDNWLKSAPETYKARIMLDNGTEIEFDVRYRTNTSPTAVKEPNIISLKKDNETILVLRKAKKHELEVIEDVLGILGMPAENYLKNSFNTKNIVIPEPNLIKALEKMYRNGFPRITPPINIIDDSNPNELIYLRSFMSESLRDSSFDCNLVGEYLGNLHSFGLTDKGDRQGAHYTITKNSNHHVVNIDPDFVIYTSMNALASTELPEFIQMIKEDIFPLISKKDITTVKKIRNEIVNENYEKRSNAFLEALRETV